MIEETIDLLLSGLPRSSAADLDGFAIDCDNAFSGPAPLFRSSDVVRSDNPRCMVRIRIGLDDYVPYLQSVNEALEAAWASVTYNDYQASACLWYSDAMVLRFVTASPGRGLLVTGEAVASGGGYAIAAAAFERDFPSGGRLPRRQP